MCESSAPAAPTGKETQITDLPEWRRNYAKDVLTKGAALTDINQNPYQQYGANRIAGFSPLQQRSMQDAANMRPSQQLGTATDLASAAGIGALGTNYQGGQFAGGVFGKNAADYYMNPYQQNVIDIGKREATRQSAIQGTQQQAQATQSGAFGGSRDAIMRAERERNLSQQMGDIQAQGSNAAFQQAQQQFNADQARYMQAQQLGEQSRQYGAGLDIQGLQTALQGASQLGQLGSQQFQQGMDVNKLQSLYGGQMQQQAQRPLDMAYQDFQNQQNYPYKQLGYMSDLVNSGPVGQQSTKSMYEAPGSIMGQAAGLGLGAYGISQLVKAGGGMVHDYAEGGVTSDQNVEGILSKLSDEQLQQAKQGALARRDVEQANMIDAEMAMRASARNGIGAGIPPEFADQMEESMASGGIVAFADKGAVKDEEASSPFYDLLGKFGRAINPAASGSQKELESKQAVMDKARELRNEEPDFFSVMKPSEREAKTKDIEQRRKGLSEVAGKVSSGDYSAVDALKNKPKQGLPQMSKEDMAKIDDQWAAVQKEGRDYAAKVADNAPPQQPPAQKTKNLQTDSKPSKAEVKSAVAQFAEQQGVSKGEKDDYMAMALKLNDELGKRDQPILDRLNAAIEAQKPNEQAIKDRGIAQALAQFGFGMAERASRPGARFLESASGAAPVLASVAEKTNSLIDAKKENYTKMQLDQAKYEMALSQGKMQTAATLAGNIRQSQQQDKMLDFNIAKAQDDLQMEKAKLAQTGAYYSAAANRIPETVTGLAKELMKDPAFKGTPNDAIAQAANMLKGGIPAGIRSETALAEARAKAIEKVDASLTGKLFALTNESDPKYAERKKKYDQQVLQQMQQLIPPGALPSIGNTSPSGSGSNIIRFNAQGNPI
jgi:hypothetical protein